MRPIAAWALLLLLAVPPGAAQTPVDECLNRCRPPEGAPTRSTLEDTTTDVFLYGHVVDGLVGAWMTTQLPSVELDPDVSSGFITPTLVTNTGTPADMELRYSFLLRPSASRVRVHDGHLQSGSAPTWAPFELGDGLIHLLGYVSLGALPTGQSGVGAAPQVQVAAKWVAGTSQEEITLAEGVSRAFDMVNKPGRDAVYEVEVPLLPRVRFYPDTPWSRIEVRAYQVSQETGEVGQTFRIRAGVDFPWRVIMPVKNALTSPGPSWSRSSAGPEVTWAVASPFGSYDVDPSSIGLRIWDSQKQLRELPPTHIVDRTNYHGWEYGPLPATWRFAPSEIDALSASTGEVVARNLQGTFELVQPVEFSIESLRPVEVPGPSSALVVLALAGLLWRRRT